MAQAADAKEYEQAIMDAHARGVKPPQLEPPQDYAMSSRFQTWLVAKMRDEVMGQADGVVRMLSEEE